MHSNKLLTAVALSAATLLFAAPARANIDIIPEFSTGINSDPNSAQIKATINQAIAVYESKITNNITVHLRFQKGGGLGSSSTQFRTVSYTAFRAALANNAFSPNDAIALAHLPLQATNPVNGSQNVLLSTANARALGLTTFAGTDSTISLNTSIMNLQHGVVTDPSHYDLLSVVSHEIDEGLGTISGLEFSGPWAVDMFRYDGNGNRSYTTDTSQHAYFSLDGKTNVVEYNQYQRTDGDWGDWAPGANPQVQDWIGTAGSHPDLGVAEWTALDAVGYNFAPQAVPEPATMAALGFGALAILRRRKKNA